jgi:hypothetical protein
VKEAFGKLLYKYLGDHGPIDEDNLQNRFYEVRDQKMVKLSNGAEMTVAMARKLALV